MHVKLNLTRRSSRRLCDPDLGGHLEIDGADFSNHVIADSVVVDYDGLTPKIYLILIPETVEITGDMQVVLGRIQAEREPEDPHR